MHGVEAQPVFERALDRHVVQVDHDGVVAGRVAAREGHHDAPFVAVAVAEAHVAAVDAARARGELVEDAADVVDVVGVDDVGELRAFELGRRVAQQGLDRGAEERDVAAAVDHSDHVARVRDQ